MLPFRKTKSWSPKQLSKAFAESREIPEESEESSVLVAQMKRTDKADEVIVSIDTNGGDSRRFPRSGVPHFNVLHANPALLHDYGEGETGSTPLECKESGFQERGLNDERNDAIWEECASPGAVSVPTPEKEEQFSRQLINQTTGDPIGSYQTNEPHEQGFPELDIHITEPTYSSLQAQACRPLSDHLAERDFSLVPKTSGTVLSKTRPSELVPAKQDALKQGSEGNGSSDLANSLSFRANKCTEQVKKTETIALRTEVAGYAQASATTPVETVNFEAIAARDVLAKKAGAEGAKLQDRMTDSENEKSKGLNKATGESDRLMMGASSRILTPTKTKSRLEEPASRAEGKASTGNSGLGEGKEELKPKTPSERLSKAALDKPDDEEDDPFVGSDFPERYSGYKWSWMILLQWAAFIILTGGLVCSLTFPILENHQVWGLGLWKWALLVLVVFCGRLVSGWFIRAIVFFVEKNFLFRKRVLYFVYGMRKGVQNCLWLGLILIAWKLMFDPKVERSTKNNKALSVITKLLESFLVAAAIWLVKILIVKVLASSFHVNTYFDRIQGSLFDQYVLETLSGPPLVEIEQIFDVGIKPNAPEERATFKSEVQLKATLSRKSAGIGISQRKDDKTSTAINVEQLQKLNARNISAWNMKRLINLVKNPGISSVFQTLDESEPYDQDSKDIEINSEMEAKAIAKKIFKNVAKPHSRNLDTEDLLRFMQPNEVRRALPLFEGAKETGKITKESLKNWVVGVYQERRALAHSLNDTKTAVDDLHRLISILVAVIIIIISLLILGIATTHVLVFVSSQFLLIAFMFGNTCKQVFESIVFLFIMHPYDIGDRCVIDGVQMVVEEMTILTTIFLRFDNEKIYYPNSVLAFKPISNLNRSPDMGDSFDFSVHISTSMEKIAALKEKIAGYIESKASHWYPKHTVIVKEIEDMNRMRMSLYMRHTINFQNIGERWARRSDLLLALKKYFEELGIEYRLLPQDVHLHHASLPLAI